MNGLPTAGAPAGVQLITYPDSIGGDLEALDELLSTDLAGRFPGGVHVLPPFPSSGDRGFAPITYLEIDPQFGTWSELGAVARHGGLVLDVMINHVSRSSPEFRAFEAHGRSAPEADLFITLDKVWPDGDPPAGDVERIFLRKPEHPFSDITIADTGETERIWTSFGPRVDWSEQIDLDIDSEATWALYRTWFEHLAGHGATTIRLDAVGYVTKRAGTACFMVEPEIWDFLDRIATLAADHGLAVLPEVHDTRPVIQSLWSRGYTTYNFVLPGLVLHGLLTARGDLVREELRRCGANQVTMLDCHDGIGIQPDLTGVLPEDEMRRVVEICRQRGASVSPLLGTRPGAFDAHQINITYPSACGRDEAYLAARALQLFAPGTPQVYYVGLLAGQNDTDALADQGDRRAINRRNYSLDEARAALTSPVAQAQLDLIGLRNSHPAFGGTWSVPDRPDHIVTIRWQLDRAWCELTVDFEAGVHEVSFDS
jgi:sucrose phosphorylase